LSPFLFAVFLNDLEQFMEDKNITGLENISSELEAQLEIYLKNFALLYADNTVLMLLNNFYEYSKLWKLIKYISNCASSSLEIFSKPVIFLSSINCSRSFKNTANKKGDKFSPYLTPTSLEKKSDLLSL
jgi:hypothetical protein